jgi:hypothetical protein
MAEQKKDTYGRKKLYSIGSEWKISYSERKYVTCGQGVAYAPFN